MAVLPTQLLRSCTDGAFMCLAEWANTTTDGWFWTAVLLGFIITLFIATQKFGTNRSLGFASTFGVFGSLILVTLGLMTWPIASIFMIVGAIGLVIMVMNNR